MSTEVTPEGAVTTGSSSGISESATTLAASTGAAPVVLGQGYDTFLGTGKDIAVSIGQPAKTGSGSELDCTICIDQTTLSTTLRLSASASASRGSVGVDAKAKFSQSLEFSSTSVAVVVYSSSIRNTQTALGVNLKKQAMPTDDSASVDTFVNKYGDSYVNQVVTGGEYLAVYLFHAESVEQQTSVYGKIDTELKGKTSSFDATLQASLDTICTEVQVRQNFQELILGTTVRRGSKSVVDFASAFGDPAAGEGLDDDGLAILSYTVDMYERLTTMPAAFDPVIANRALYNYGSDGQSGLGDQHAKLCAIQSTAENIAGTYAAYGYTGDATLASRKAAIDEDVVTLQSLFREMSAYPTKSQSAPKLQGLSWGTPSLNYRFDSAVVAGGLDGGGNPFQDVNADSVPLRKRLKKFNAWGHDVVDKIASTYTDVSAAGETTSTHGGTSDKSTEAGTLTLADSERITLVWGTWDKVVHQIKIATANSQTFTCPPHPEKADESYSWAEPATGDTFLVGFNGRSSKDDLNQLDIKVAIFNKAKWS